MAEGRVQVRPEYTDPKDAFDDVLVEWQGAVAERRPAPCCRGGHDQTRVVHPQSTPW